MSTETTAAVTLTERRTLMSYSTVRLSKILRGVCVGGGGGMEIGRQLTYLQLRAEKQTTTHGTEMIEDIRGKFRKHGCHPAPVRRSVMLVGVAVCKQRTDWDASFRIMSHEFQTVRDCKKVSSQMRQHHPRTVAKGRDTLTGATSDHIACAGTSPPGTTAHTVCPPTDSPASQR